MKKNILILGIIATVLLVVLTLAIFLLVDDECYAEDSWSNGFCSEGIYVNDCYWEEQWLYERGFPSFNNFIWERYYWLLETETTDIVVGQIENEEMAREKAEAVWLEIFSDRGISITERLESAHPFRVLHDEQNDVWFLSASPSRPSGWTGVFPHIFIRGSDGKVLAVWMQ